MTISIAITEAVLTWIRQVNATHFFAFIVCASWFWKLQGGRSSFNSSSKNKKDPRALSRSGSTSSEDESLSSLPPTDINMSPSNAERWLEVQVPESTAEERHRFLTAKKGGVALASKYLSEYVAWKRKHSAIQQTLSIKTKTDDKDLHDWNVAASTAMRIQQGNDSRHLVLPQIARMLRLKGKDIRCRQGYRILSVTPGLMDDRLAPLSVYALAIALYMDRKLERNSLDRITVLIDARGGQGWRNIHAAQLLPFIQGTSKLLLSLFPERLARSLVYPIPRALGWIWNIAKRCIDPLTAEKICLLTGPATIRSLPPVSQMAMYLDHDTINHIENERLASFITSTTTC